MQGNQFYMSQLKNNVMKTDDGYVCCETITLKSMNTEQLQFTLEFIYYWVKARGERG